MSRGGAVADLDAEVDRCAAPARVAAALETLREREPDLGGRLDARPELIHRLVTVLAASRSLTRVVLSQPEALDVLDDLGSRLPVDAATVERLAEWKRLELLRIAARDLVELDE
ncbi:MAG TPA: hypothetical protein VMT43_12615, partial [Acidimicrobiales bacterium]|nr:hypothetical protein [Acidimicrobiales bacterium]